MAKKRQRDELEQQRQSRKEILLARKQQQQTRQIRLAIMGVVALIAVVMVIGFVNELLIKPGQPVATVNGDQIIMSDWQERVQFQRAQIVIGLDDLANTFGQDIGLVQQYAGQQINLLIEPESMGQLVLEDLIDETLIRQAAEERGIVVSDADVDEAIQESFNYFGGSVPTAVPTATNTPIPTPSLTPIPTQVITEVLPTNTPLPTATTGPTSTPFPTATAVSQEAFQEDFRSTLSRFKGLGVSEGAYYAVVRASLYRERLTDAIAEERGLESEAEQASFFYISFEDEAEAQAALAEGDDFLTVWNTIRSGAAEDAAESTASASEILWRAQDSVEELFGSEVAAAVFELPVDEPSDLLVKAGTTEDALDTYYLIMVSGREVRALTEGAFNNLKQEELNVWIEEQRTTADIVTFEERWRANVPTRPLLDPRFLIPPTAAPTQPTISIPEPVGTPIPEATPEG
jgi:predicted nucleic acid-binding Zn ribbon protein